MAIGTTLGDVIEMVRKEARLSSNTSRGTDHRENIEQLIKRHQQVLADSYDWQHLELKREMAFKQMVAGQRVYDFPTNLNTDKISEVWYKYGSVWHQLDYGISYNELNSQDSDDGETSDPVVAWDYYGALQFEVFPVPAGNTGIISFLGQKKLTPLIDDDSRLDLDDILISLYVAAEILAGNDQKGAAEIKAQAASSRLDQMRAGKGSQRRVTVGNGAVSINYVRRPREIKFVR